MNKRYRRGLATLEQVDGPAGLAVATRLAWSFPDFERLLVEFPFGDVYARPGLALREREITTVAALTALGHAAPQLEVRVHAAPACRLQPGGGAGGHHADGRP